MKLAGYTFLLIICGCQIFKDPPHRDPTATTVLQEVDTARLPLTLNCRESLKHFYSQRENSFFWIRDLKLAPPGDSLLQFIAGADRYGLDPRQYHIDEFGGLFADSVSEDRYMMIDVLLSDAFLSLHSHIGNGRLDPKNLQPVDISKAVNRKAIASLQGLKESGVRAAFAALEPQAEQYKALKTLLAQYLDEADGGGSDSAMKISLNLERWRWQRSMPDRYVSVNIPAFMMRVYEDDSLWLETKVIVGKRETPTPVMESTVQSFTIYPYWHVPKSISTREILPQLQKNASYLRRNNFDVLDRDGAVILPDTIQWDFYTPDFFPFILRQREGSENSMGIIKFTFPNNYGVYLHDTNSKRLYANPRRDLSHGCVRVSNAVSFAHYLVREDDIYVSPEDLDQYLSLQQRLKIELRDPIAIKLEYYTVEVRDGTPYFYDDIYRKDSVMMQSWRHVAPASDLVTGL